MKRMTPILTLASGTALAAVLFTMSAQAAPPTPASSAGGAGAAAPSPAGPEEAAETPEAPDAAASPTGEPATPDAQPGATSPPPSAPAVSPAPEAAAVDGTWTGRVDGGATIALTVRQGRAVAYVCDGRSLEIWLRGTVTGTKLDLSGADGAQLTGTIDGDRVSGEIRADDKRRKFTAAKAGGTSPALYRATAADKRIDGGWIVLADGTQVGVVTWNGKPVAAPPLDPAFWTTIVKGVTVTAVPVDPAAAAGT